MTIRIFRGHTQQPAPDPLHRGIAYGDGLFETMRVHTGQVPWWSRHWQRLSEGASRLRIKLPDQDFVRQQLAALLDDAEPALARGAVLKLILSRGAAGRGYAPADAEPDWQLSLHPLPPPARADGLQLRWCQLRLARQPALAGIKHCNRLEQVLARAEWNDADIDEGLLLDDAGHVVGATSANLFVLHGGQWLTPTLADCGVAGICRGWALQDLPAREALLLPSQVQEADAVFLCNAVRGILPVARLGARRYRPHPLLADAQRALAHAHPAFATTALP